MEFIEYVKPVYSCVCSKKRSHRERKTKKTIKGTCKETIEGKVLTLYFELTYLGDHLAIEGTPGSWG